MDNMQVSQGAAARIPVLSPAHLAIAAAMATPLLLVCLRVLSPEFDPSYRMISEYALGGYGWLLSVTFLAWGVSSCALALAIRSRIRTRSGRVGLAFLVVAGVGQAMASVFDIRNDLMHNLAGALGILGLPVAAMLVTVSLSRNADWAPVRRRLLVLAHLTWISRVLLVVTFVLLVSSLMAAYGSLPNQAPASLPQGSSDWSAGLTGSWWSRTARGSRSWPGTRSACNAPAIEASDRPVPWTDDRPDGAAGPDPRRTIGCRRRIEWRTEF